MYAAYIRLSSEEGSNTKCRIEKTEALVKISCMFGIAIITEPLGIP